MDPRRITGDRGEDLAAQYLTQRGWQVLERNWRTTEGEIDLVCRDPEGVVVVCEVKTRRGLGYGSPLEAITHTKARRLRRLAAAYARQHAGPVPSLRVDAVGILWHPDGTAAIQHVRGIEP
ncbi:MAG: YraN family protein [Propionibacteriaceae bacterium]|nr:YraN family protein [Propionibacteriaceae bacterium]